MLRGLRSFLKNCLSKGRPENSSSDRVKEREVEKESGRRATLRSRERLVYNQTGSVLTVTPRGPLRNGAERVWPFPSAKMPSGSEAGNVEIQKNLH